jgi:hypothetical protein
MPETKLQKLIRKLDEHRAKMHNPPTLADEKKERRLLRAYRREVENGC